MPDAGDELDEHLLAAYIGPNWEPYYRERFARFREEPRRRMAWNWAAALVPFWPVYRNLDATIPLYFAAAVALVGVSGFWFDYFTSAHLYVAASLLTVGAACGAIEGLFGTWALHHKARTAVARARRRAGSDEAALLRLRRGYGPGSIPAALSFLVSSAVLLYLAVALAAWGDTKEKAYIATMKQDLHNLVAAQGEFRMENRRFAVSLNELTDQSIS